MADARVHVGVVKPKFIKAPFAGIDLGQAVLNGKLAQTRINQLSLLAQPLRTIAFQCRAVEIPEGEKKSVRLAGAFEDGRAGLQNLADNAAVIRLLGPG